MKFHEALIVGIWLAWTLINTSCSDKTETALQDKVVSSTEATKPIFLWRVTDPRKAKSPPLYLYGTVHLTVQAQAYLDKVVLETLDRSEQLYLEIIPEEGQNPEVAALVGRLGALPPGRQLKDVLTPETYKKLETYLASQRIPEDTKAKLQRLQPWLVSMSLTLMVFQNQGMSPQYGAESQLAAYMRKAKKTLGALETVKQQIESLAAGNSEEQDYMLNQSIDELTAIVNGSQGDTHELFSAYHEGDLKRLSSYAQKIATDPRSKSFNDRILVERNRKMAQKIRDLLTNDKTEFVAVGALHLAGPSSIIELLQKQGFKITRMRAKGRTDAIIVADTAQASAPPPTAVQPKLRLRSLGVELHAPGQYTEQKQALDGYPDKHILAQTYTAQTEGQAMTLVNVMTFPEEVSTELENLDVKDKRDFVSRFATAFVGELGDLTPFQYKERKGITSASGRFNGKEIKGRFIVYMIRHELYLLVFATPKDFYDRADIQEIGRKFFDSIKFRKSVSAAS